eukprot:12409094-Karenia_brevis.AAC.1
MSTLVSLVQNEPATTIPVSVKARAKASPMVPARPKAEQSQDAVSSNGVWWSCPECDFKISSVAKHRSQK